jgi:hypothetical protein
LRYGGRQPVLLPRIGHCWLFRGRRIGRQKTSIPSPLPVILVNGKPSRSGVEENAMECAVLIYGDANEWRAQDDTARDAVMAAHRRFAERCAAAGYTIVIGRELGWAADAKTLRRTTDGHSVTDGPFAETAEQLGGLYLIEADGVDALTDLVRACLLESTIEIRPIVDHGE